MLHAENKDVPKLPTGETEGEPPCRLVQFEGELRADHVEALDAIVGDDPSHVVVDCTRVVSYDEQALEALVDFEHRAEAAGGKVLLVGVCHPQQKTSWRLTPVDAPPFSAA